MQFLRETREYRTAIEKELEVWVDLLTETDSIDRETLKRAVSLGRTASKPSIPKLIDIAFSQSLYLTPYDYDQVEHERHLASMCSYPLCASASRRPYTSQSHYTFRSTGVVSPMRTTRNRDLIHQEEGNKDDGFCCKDCLIRSRWYGRRLRDEAIWTRNEVAPGDYGRWKSKARGTPGEEGLKAALEVELLEEMEERGEVLLRNGSLLMKGSFSPIQSKASLPEEPRISISTASAKSADTLYETSSQPELPLNGLVKMGLIAETREHPSRFEDQLNATLASLQIVERVAPMGTPEPPKLPTEPSERRKDKPANYVRMEPTSKNELLPESQQSLGGHLGTRTGDQVGQQDEDEDEDDEIKMAFEAAYAAREMLRNGDFE